MRAFRGPSFVATVLAAVFGCLLDGAVCERRSRCAYMGENAFVAFTVAASGL